MISIAWGCGHCPRILLWRSWALRDPRSPTVSHTSESEDSSDVRWGKKLHGQWNYRSNELELVTLSISFYSDLASFCVSLRPTLGSKILLGSWSQRAPSGRMSWASTWCAGVDHGGLPVASPNDTRYVSPYVHATIEREDADGWWKSATVCGIFSESCARNAGVGLGNFLAGIILNMFAMTGYTGTGRLASWQKHHSVVTFVWVDQDSCGPNIWHHHFCVVMWKAQLLLWWSQQTIKMLVAHDCSGPPDHS